MNLLCIGSFYLILVDCLLLFFLLVVSTCVVICLVPVLDGFPSLIFNNRVFLLAGNPLGHLMLALVHM
jgi:hypothetical protein